MPLCAHPADAQQHVGPISVCPAGLWRVMYIVRCQPEGETIEHQAVPHIKQLRDYTFQPYLQFAKLKEEIESPGGHSLSSSWQLFVSKKSFAWLTWTSSSSTESSSQGKCTGSPSCFGARWFRREVSSPFEWKSGYISAPPIKEYLTPEWVAAGIAWICCCFAFSHTCTLPVAPCVKFPKP